MKDQSLLFIHIGIVMQELSDESRLTVETHAKTLRELVEVDPFSWTLAIALVGAELADKP